MDTYDWPPIGGNGKHESKATMISVDMLTVDNDGKDSNCIVEMTEFMRKHGYPDNGIYPEVKWNGKSYTVVLGKSRVISAINAGLAEIPVIPDRAVVTVVNN